MRVPILLNFEAFFRVFRGILPSLAAASGLSISATQTHTLTHFCSQIIIKEREIYYYNKNVVRRRSFSGAERDIISPCVFFFCFCGVVKNDDEFDERPKDESLVLVVVFFFFFFIGLDKDQNVVGFLLLLILLFLRNADAFLENAYEW